MEINRKRVARRIVSGLVAGAVALGGLAISGGSVSAKTPSSPSTNRIAGDDRYETAVEVARDYYSNPSTTFGTKGVIIASGETPYDALAAAPLAGLKDAPILLVKKDSLPASVADLLDDYKTNFRANALTQKIYVIGGTSAISDDVVAAVTTITDGATATQKMPVVRLAGDDRYKTAAAITGVAGLMDASDRLIIVNGTSWADALAAGSIAAEKKWPIMLTGNGGLNDDAKAVVETFRKLAGSSKDILLVGGPAVLPGSIEEYLDSKGVRFSDIDRRGGVDRYHTSLLMNLYQLNGALAAIGAEGSLTSAFAGSKVALVSGESPWDALVAGPWSVAKSGVHIQMTKASAIETFAATLAGALGNKAINRPSDLYIIGGKSAVSQATRDGFIAAAAASDTTTTMDCTVKSDKVYLTFAGGLTKTEASVITNPATVGAYFTKNGVKHSTSAFLNGTASNHTGYSVDATGAADYVTFEYDMTSNAAAADVIAFSGIPEGLVSGISRSLAGSSCTVAQDAVAPTASVKFVVKDGVFNHAVVTLSEIHQQMGSGAAADGSNTSLTANSSWKYADGTYVFTDAASSTLSAYKVSNKTYIVSLSAASASYSAVTVAANTAIYLEKSNIKDLSGNAMASDSGTTATTDLAKPVMTVGDISCVADAKTTITRNGLTLTAAKKGVAGNSWTLAVVNQRGLLTPTIVEDSTAKTVTITADTSYHTTDDLVKIAKNSGVNAVNWVYSGSGAVPAETTLGPVNWLTSGGSAGDQDCSAAISFSEPVVISGSPSVTVANVAATAVSMTQDDYATAFGVTDHVDGLVFFTTTGSGAVNITGIVATDRVGLAMASSTNSGGTLS